MNITDTLSTVVNGANLSEEEAFAAFEQIMQGDVPESVMAALLVALRIKGETVDEIAETRTDYRDMPRQKQIMKSVTVDTFGETYPEPQKI